MPSSKEKDQDPDTFIGLAFPLGFANDGVFRKTKNINAANFRELFLRSEGIG